ncbi:MAG: NADPH-dependent F420 reductase [Candidatus Hodarchaeales archaeon]|jgi:NADPH-dependent F420 reductase
MQIGIIGGTGPQGKGIALRWAISGRNIIIGSRSLDKAQKNAGEINKISESSNVLGLLNEDMIKQSQIILLTVPFEHASKTIKEYQKLLREHCKIFVDVTVPMTRVKGKGMVYMPITEGSSVQMFQKLLNPIPVVGAFKTIGAHALLQKDKLINRDTFVVGPKNERLKLIELISEINGLRAINAGPTQEAQTIERLVPFLININRRYKVKDAGIVIQM